MNHLSRKITFAGGKSKPKPQPATLTPPKVGDLSIASSYTYAETLDLISDGPIGGLVNKNGLLLTDKDILQGIYLDNTPIAVSNDAVVLSKPIFDDTFQIKSFNIIDKSVKFFENIKNLLLSVDSNVTPDKGYTAITSFQDWGIVYDYDLNASDSFLKPNTDLVRSVVPAEINLLKSNTDTVNTFPFTFYFRINDADYEDLYMDARWLTAFKATYFTTIQNLINYYNGTTTVYGNINDASKIHEKKYLDKMLTRNLGNSWKGITSASLLTSFLNIAMSNDANNMYYIIKADGKTCELNTVLDADGNLLDLSFRLETIDFEDNISSDKNIKIYDFILPRINSNGVTSGSCIGLLLVVITGKIKGFDNNKGGTGIISFSLPTQAINDLSNIKYLNLRKVTTASTTAVDTQKYNYTNILAEYRPGDEYQSPFKYINHVLIDKIYGNDLFGPFKQIGDVQRIKETATMISNNPTATKADGTLSPLYYQLTTGGNAQQRILNFTEGSLDGTAINPRNNPINFSEWNLNQINYDEDAIAQKHIIYNPNVSGVFITLCINRLSDTLSKSTAINLKGSFSDRPTTLDAGTKFPTIVNFNVEMGKITSLGEEVATNSRNFSIVALIESPTYIDIGNPDGAAYVSNDYKFISEYIPANGSSIFTPFVVPNLTERSASFVLPDGVPFNGTVGGVLSTVSSSALDSNEKRYIKVKKLSTETNSTLISKDISLSKVTEIIPLNFEYPHSAIIGTKIDSRSFSNIPTRTFDCKLKKVKVPSNYFPCFDNGKDKRYYNSADEYTSSSKLDKMIYDGDWDGSFKDELEWTDNPAWILYDLLTNNRYGLGQYIDENQIDIFDLYKIGRFCDSIDDFGYFVGVSDGSGGLEPRFSCNIYFQEGIKLFDAINTISSLFRGMIYYTNSEINFLDDRPKDPIALFTNINVKDGFFNYTNYKRDEQFNSIEVVYIDRFENFQTKVEYVEDEEDIRKRGIFKKTINANGVTSKAMARRIGQHIIYQTIKENQSVSFTAGLESLLCRPGDLIIVEDELKSLKSNFGKVLNIDLIKNSIRVNEKFSVNDYNNKITVYTPTGYETREDILNINNNKRSRLDGFYLNQGGWSSDYNYLTGDYSFARYSDGFSEEKAGNNILLQEQYAFYTGSSSRFCYFSTGFTGWVLGTGLPFKDNMSYDKFIMAQNSFTFDSVNRASGYFYNTSVGDRRGSSFNVALNSQLDGVSSKFKNVSGELNDYTNGLLDSDIQLSNPSQITTFGVSGVVNYDYGSEVFIDQRDINASLLQFAKIGSPYRFQRKSSDDQVYKILSISEQNPNEYSLVCNKYDIEKYKLIENQKSIEHQSNTYSYTLTQKINNTTYSVLNAPVITALTTGVDPSNNNAFYISGDWRSVSNAAGYNIRLYNPNNSFTEVTVGPTILNYVFYNESSVGNYSFRIKASGSNANAKELRAQTYFDSDYNSSGIFIVYEDSRSLIYDRPFLSSITIL